MQDITAHAACAQAVRSLLDELSSTGTRNGLITELQQSLAAHDAAMEELRSMVSAVPESPAAEADQRSAAR